MSAPGNPAVAGAATRDSRYWLVFIVRAAVAIVVAFAITFSADHSPVIGFVWFGAFAVASGLVAAVLGLARLRPGTERSFFVVQGIVSVVAGAIALLTSGAGVAFLLFLMSAWAAITGVLELYIGFRARRSFVQGRDWIFAGALTVVLAIVVLVIPANFHQEFTGPDGVARSLTASVVLVGALGAYAAILGVYLVIAGLSLKWGTQRASTPVVESGN